ncbi:8-amino-7-oxononanoate synthase [Grimontia celer]|uniref:8-amino-7-ketopelargonate synthase n=1 Tax=Grimontia celer TaxID=1796497 RepID=A0A128EXI2_9GAMM|nr:8-amino-7-oxononanoate synthase [Grimontia celer]CZF79279.1 8-amino-7-oxononanoate synthase [Grimontia celer]
MREQCQLQSRIEHRLEVRRQQRLHRQVAAFSHQDGLITDSGNRQFANFSGNDYLGLAQDASLIKAWQEGLSLYGAGSTASPLVTGFSKAHQFLEDKLCNWLGFDRAILFNSGFSANQAVIFSLLEKGDLLLQDKLNHASLMEAGMLSEATMKRFPHNDVTKLGALLQKAGSPTLTATEGVFSMDGDLSPLADVKAQCEAHGSWLMVDDAHGCGILGEDGRGSSNHAGIKPDILIVTFGKAFGMMGAAVLCSESVHDYLTQFARHYVYSTAMPPAQAHALTQAVEVISTQSWRREKLASLSELFHSSLADASEVIPTVTPIKPVVLGDVERMQIAATSLKASGFWTGAIRPPTVPANSSRLRITLSVNQTESQVKALAETLSQILREVS